MISDSPAHPVRIAVTADLHYDPPGHLTAPHLVEVLVGRIRDDAPDAVIIAGDLAHGLDNFAACLALFDGFEVPVGVMVGNHDIWRDKDAGHSSAELWEMLLPEAVRRAGAIWLEEDVIRLGDVVILGSLAWYDYSAVDPGVRLPLEEVAKLKYFFNNDAIMIDWDRTDPDFAADLGKGLQDRLAGVSSDDDVRAVVVVTHVPLLEEQLLRKPHDERWSISNAYFGNLTLGHAVMAEPKVQFVISGHTHVGRQATVRRDGLPPIETRVVPSDYGRPARIIIEI